jgi:hypothetical protein
MKSLTLGKKIAAGFAGLIIIAAVLGCLAIFSMKTVQKSSTALAGEYVPQTDVATRLADNLASAQLAIRSYALTGDRSYLESARKDLAAVHECEQAAQKLAAEHAGLGALRECLQQLSPELRKYEDLVAKTEAHNAEIVTTRAKMDQANADFMANVEKLIAGLQAKFEKEITAAAGAAKLEECRQRTALATTIRAQVNRARIAAFQAQTLRDGKILEEGVKNFSEVDKTCEQLLAMTQAQEDVAQSKSVQDAAHAFRDAMKQLIADNADAATLARQRLSSANAVADAAGKARDTGMQRTVDTATLSSQKLANSSWTMILGLAIALVVAVAMAFGIIRNTNTTLSRVATSLDESASQVSSAASQVSSSSQSLAEGASEQAASLEETSSSLEEMSSMTRRNAENSQKANDLARETRGAADKGVTDMKDMTMAMEAIKVSSDDIAKIIKTIDEIAFQTNILALNAAVEAARAGEAGMGFAVVADEVRNLAQRSAQAAKETSAKIEGAIAKTTQGVAISSKVAKTLEEIVTRARQVDELVAEVATASREQSQGITQVNLAVGQMDKVTQSNAANAEESAAAAEELNAQAETMKDSVKQLLRLVGGNGASEAIRPGNTIVVRAEKRAPVTSEAGVTTVQGNGHTRVTKSASPARGTSLELAGVSRRNEPAKPLDDEFKDF